ncbi:MAG: HAD-IB family phosphatase [Clostridia bacterium]|nr:HAD-IB family phosphatase [Clostridia bacterium]
MNVFDFDKTIFKYDSSVMFYKYCLKRHPQILKYLPIQMVGGVRLFLKLRPKTECKELFYRYFRGIDDIDSYLEDFWDKNICYIQKWYKDMQRQDDVIISASPEFLLAPACRRLGIKYMMATRVDRHTGIHDGINCHGEEKVRRFYEAFPQGKVDKFYSDSRSDTPLANIAREAYLVDGETLTPW